MELCITALDCVCACVCVSVLVYEVSTLCQPVCLAERSGSGLWENAPLIQSSLDDKAAISYTQQTRRRERRGSGQGDEEDREGRCRGKGMNNIN